VYHVGPARVSTIFLLLLATFLPTGLTAHAAGPWTAAAAPQAVRDPVRAASLPNGQVFVRWYQSAERYDAVTDSWTLIAKDLNPLQGPALTILASGDVLVIGGLSCGHCGGNNVELYDASTGTLTRRGFMRQERGYHTATTLTDGRVLVTGGAQGAAAPWAPSAGPYATTELYDPAANTWSAGPPMSVGRALHTATRLADGRVLVVGGASGAGSATAELYDPTTNAWTAAAAPAAARGGHSATLLTDGRVLSIGGAAGIGPALATGERYDAATDTWQPIANAPGARSLHTATLLVDGTLLVTGGQVGIDPFNGSPRGYGPLASAIRYTPATDTWDDAGMMSAPRAEHAAVALADGRLVVIGNVSADRFTPATTAQCFAATGHCLQGRFLTYWQGHGGLAINGYPLGDEFTETLEDGRPYTVQYFERVRLEYHPENANPQYQVLLGQFGRRIHPADPPALPAPGTRYFTETGHNLGGSFQRYWEANGGLAQFGYPLTDEFKEQLADGNTYTVQYFERARFEYHPENSPPYDVLLGQFGRQILGNR